MPRFKRTALVQIIILFIAITAGRAQNTPAQPLDLYILIGQSNMAGRGPITTEIANEKDNRVYMFTKDKQWVTAKHPLHFDKPSVAGVGPGLTFGLTMEQSNPQHLIGLIPCAVGGTPIEHWVPGAYDQATKTHPYDDAVERITAAMKYGTVKGVIWHQGESNSSPEKAKDYLAKLMELIQRVRTLVGNPNLPFVVGELGRYRPAYANINTQLAKLPATVPFTALASSEGLVHKGDTTHFDGPSAQEMGRRLAQQMLKVQGQVKK
ncbi:sialate O-acetylesterase [Mucilaginibacter mali]|uniref:Sialate O-acetylesterase n=1 Tax=Mucilaginibacter mali TaxID=2740462 RepID=A0A7D4Q8Q2_9SPHI|nr:sialate O-acetylesterase [Mucilaginibacter mali]QKJ29024.1 sialate O-acetylesterase [Mucilaginibacter mali]